MLVPATVKLSSFLSAAIMTSANPSPSRSPVSSKSQLHPHSIFGEVGSLSRAVLDSSAPALNFGLSDLIADAISPLFVGAISVLSSIRSVIPSPSLSASVLLKLNFST